MITQTDWDNIRFHTNKSFKSNLHVSVASVGENNMPTVTPIGSLFLNKNSTGFYFEKYITKIAEHSKTNKNICVLVVNSNKWFWIKSLFKGKFQNNPAIKLYGTLGKKRKATEHETSRLHRRMRFTKGLKGNTYLWGKMEYIREITFYKAEKINLGLMTKS